MKINNMEECTIFDRLTAEKIKKEKRIVGKSLERFQASYADALKLAPLLAAYPSPNFLSTAEDGEIVLEWYGRHHHLVVSLDGDGEYGYSYALGGEIVSGKHAGFCDKELPEDMSSVLNIKQS